MAILEQILAFLTQILGYLDIFSLIWDILVTIFG